MFGRKKTPEEKAREELRAVRRANRTLERERAKLNNEEKKIQLQIKKAAQRGSKEEVKALAKQIVGVRQQREKSFKATAKFNELRGNISEMNINSKVANSVQAASKVMAGANKSMNIHHVQKTMANYQKESELAGIRNELIEDTMNSLTEDNEEEEENVVNAILDEIGIDISSGLKAPSSSLPASEAADSEADLLARLQELKS